MVAKNRDLKNKNTGHSVTPRFWSRILRNFVIPILGAAHFYVGIMKLINLASFKNRNDENPNSNELHCKAGRVTGPCASNCINTGCVLNNYNYFRSS